MWWQIAVSIIACVCPNFREHGAWGMGQHAALQMSTGVTVVLTKACCEEDDHGCISVYEEGR